MKAKQIFIGNIRECTKSEEHITTTSKTYSNGECVGSESMGYINTESDIYRENAILIKIKNGGYVDLTRLNSILDYIKVRKDITKWGFRLGGLIMASSANRVGKLFVDENSLKSYYGNAMLDSNDKASIRQLRKQLHK